VTPANVLAFDTSAAHCAAALLSGDRVLHRAEPMDKGQAERLMPLLEELLAEAGIGWHDLAAIGVGTGPGNSTGVRISVAAARGLALGLGIKAIGVTALEAAAQGLPRPLAVVQDARRGAVYVQAFDPEPGPAQLVPLEDLGGIIGAIAVTGSAAHAAGALTGGPVLVPAMPLAEAIARIAQARMTQTAPRPAPFYLRGADAIPSSDPPVVILP
jgi:tRNA threonylcarbamoyladenosine biosynthesis protein TsaB